MDLVGVVFDIYGIFDLDLVIRMFGEQWVLNFLIWQIVYFEFVFLLCYWFDFDEIVFKFVIDEYCRCDCWFGGLSVWVV